MRQRPSRPPPPAEPARPADSSAPGGRAVSGVRATRTLHFGLAVAVPGPSSSSHVVRQRITPPSLADRAKPPFSEGARRS